MGIKQSSKLLVVALMLSMFSANVALAGSGITAITQERRFGLIISLGFGVFAVTKWFDYFSNFKPESALKEIFAPAMLTYLAFQWQQVLSWFNLG